SCFSPSRKLVKRAIKKYKLTRAVERAEGSFEKEEKLIPVNIKAAVPAETELRFPETNDKRHGKIARDVIFVVVEKPHPFFTRCGIDVTAVVKLTPAQATKGSVIKTSSLSGGVIQHQLTEDVKTGDVTRLTGQGIPSASDQADLTT
ncbi:hypothetical protein MTO96_039891, partial [Rhipicephalus appendiculatus]